MLAVPPGDSHELVQNALLVRARACSVPFAHGADELASRVTTDSLHRCLHSDRWSVANLVRQRPRFGSKRDESMRTAGIVDADHTSFFDAVRATLPLDPLVGSRSWDALSDSLWEGLYLHAGLRCAILWPGADTLAARSVGTFETALAVLADVAKLLADPVATCDHPKEVVILVEALNWAK